MGLYFDTQILMLYGKKVSTTLYVDLDVIKEEQDLEVNIVIQLSEAPRASPTGFNKKIVTKFFE